MTTEAYIFDAVRTPRGRGKKDGSLHKVSRRHRLQVYAPFFSLVFYNQLLYNYNTMSIIYYNMF